LVARTLYVPSTGGAQRRRASRLSVSILCLEVYAYDARSPAVKQYACTMLIRVLPASDRRAMACSGAGPHAIQ
jgi:hypothetical protein